MARQLMVEKYSRESPNRVGPSFAAPAYIAIFATVVVSAYLLWQRLATQFMIPWKASQFWVNYQDGFVRRGLPGEILSVVTGQNPTVESVTAVGIVMLIGSVIAWAFFVRVLSRPVGESGIFAAALIIVSPFAFAHIVRITGEYDNIGVVVMAGVVALARMGDLPRWLVLGVMSMAVAVAAGTEELLIAFVAPVAVAALHAIGITGRRLVPVAVVVLAPGAMVTAASLLATPSRASLLAAADAAEAAGFGTNRYTANALAALTQTTPQVVRHFLEISPVTFGLCLLLLGGCWVASIGLLWFVLGRRGGRLFWLFSASYAGAAVAVSVLAIDYRRWWSLAFAAAVATLAVLPAAAPTSARFTDVPGSHMGRSAIEGRLFALVIMVLAVSMVGQDFPLWPWWDPASNMAPVLDVRNP